MTARNATGQQTDRPTGVGSVSRNRLTGMIWEEELNFFLSSSFLFRLTWAGGSRLLLPGLPPPLGESKRLQFLFPLPKPAGGFAVVRNSGLRERGEKEKEQPTSSVTVIPCLVYGRGDRGDPPPQYNIYLGFCTFPRDELLELREIPRRFKEQSLYQNKHANGSQPKASGSSWFVCPSQVLPSLFQRSIVCAFSQFPGGQ